MHYFVSVFFPETSDNILAKRSRLIFRHGQNYKQQFISHENNVKHVFK